MAGPARSTEYNAHERESVPKQMILKGLHDCGWGSPTNSTPYTLYGASGPGSPPSQHAHNNNATSAEIKLAWSITGDTLSTSRQPRVKRIGKVQGFKQE